MTRSRKEIEMKQGHGFTVTAEEWNAGIDYLMENDEGCIECGSRSVHIENMCGGKYLLKDNGEVCGQTGEAWRAMVFLKDGTVR